MERFYPEAVDVHTLSPLALAFVGDGVYSLLVREKLLCAANRQAGDLHHAAVGLVCAEAQAAAVERLLPVLTAEEEAAYKRGRNAHTARTGAEYHKATGLEALFGYLYLDGRLERVRELFGYCVGENDREDAE